MLTGKEGKEKKDSRYATNSVPTLTFSIWHLHRVGVLRPCRGWCFFLSSPPLPQLISEHQQHSSFWFQNFSVKKTQQKHAIFPMHPLHPVEKVPSSFHLQSPPHTHSGATSGGLEIENTHKKYISSTHFIDFVCISKPILSFCNTQFWWMFSSLPPFSPQPAPMPKSKMANSG